MEHISLISHNKKGTSLVELIAYVALYGVIMSLLATLVFVIVKAARKVDSQSILNRGATLMYTEILAQTININPDTVSDVVYKNASGAIIDDPSANKANIDSISITFMKKYDYATADGNPAGKKEGERYEIENPSSITFTFYKKDSTNAPEGKADNIVVTRTVNGSTTTAKINLDYGMYISSSEVDDNIYKCIQVAQQNTSNKYVTFNGFLHFDERTMEFNFIVPVFVANVATS